MTTTSETRTSLLSRIGPVLWWVEHAGTCRCGCTLADGPTSACDVGQSLFRLAAREMGRKGAS